MKDAGRMALSMRSNLEVSQKTSPEDQVSNADLAISALIKNRLIERFREDLVISEEDANHQVAIESFKRFWLIDPIDGTQNYIMDHDDYCVMVGLLARTDARPAPVPIYGFVHAPQTARLYHGGVDCGAYRIDLNDESKEHKELRVDGSLISDSKARVLMGTRDRRAHPWVQSVQQLQLIKTGSIGLKVARILEGEADLFIHLSGKLKTWDTAGPAAIALGAGLDVGCLDSDSLEFPLPATLQECSVIMGKPGALNWCRKHLSREAIKDD